MSDTLYLKRPCMRTALLAVAAVFFSAGSVLAAENPERPAKVEIGTQAEPCRLTPQEKYWQRNPESQWPPSRRERIHRCDGQPDPGVFMNHERARETGKIPSSS